MRYPFVLQVLGWTLVAALDFSLNRATYPSDDILWAAYSSVSLGALGFAISSALLGIYRAWLPRRGSRIAAGVVSGTLVGAATWYLLQSGLDRVVDYPYSQTLSAGLFGKGMLYLFILLAWEGAYFALRASARAAGAEKLAQEARLALLRYQLNPHFLFNVLNSAIALVDEDPERAQTMLTLLSELLRKTLQSDAAEATTLEQELDLIERYLEIQRVRFEDKLRVDVDVSEGARRCAVPPLLVHTLVDNAVKHGMRTSSTMPLEVGLSAAYDGDVLRMEVRNTGSIAPRGEGVGLRNVSERLEALYPGRHRFEMAERDGAVRVTLEIRSPGLGG